MHLLDDLQYVKKIDKSNVYGSVVALADQIKDAWLSFKNLDLPTECSLAENVVISGMGGSALGGRVIKSLLKDRVRIPIEVVTDFHLPSYVNDNSLVILSSYSGNTEETLAAAHDTLKRHAKIFIITTGGKLETLARENNLPLYLIYPKFNPSNQPRTATGYSIVSIMALLARCNFIHLTDEEIGEAEIVVRKFTNEFSVEVKESNNLAKRTAVKLKNNMAILIASEHLVGAAHVMKNQLNENSKTFSCLFDLPELNHHLMEGLRNPAEAKKFWHIIFFESDKYSDEIIKRYPITEEVVAKNDVSYSAYKLRSDKKLEQIFEVITFGSFVNFYLAVLYGIDPAPIPWVDYFKQKLAT